MNVETVDNAGTPQLRQFHMVNTKTKFPRGISDQAISHANSTRGPSDVRPGPGLKQEATSNKLQSLKHLEARLKPQAVRFKLQATSIKLLDNLPLIKFYKVKGEVLNQDKCIARMSYMK